MAKATAATRIALLLLFALDGCFTLARLTTPKRPADEKPPDWAIPGIRMGEDAVEKSVFLQDERLEDIDTIQVGHWIESVAGQQVAFVSTKGVAITSLEGQVLDYVDYRNAPWARKTFGAPEIVDANGDGTWEFLYPWSEYKGAFLADRQGQYIWKSRSFIRETCEALHADVNNDGKEEFFLCGWKRMLMLDHTGNLLWAKKVPKELQGYERRLRMTNVDGDGHAFIVENLHKELRYFNEKGEFLKAVQVNPTVSLKSSLVHFPTSEGPLHFLASTNSEPRCWALVTLDGQTVVKPSFDASRDTVGFLLPVQLEPKKPAYWVTLTVRAVQGRAVAGMEYSARVLTICEPAGAKIFEETLTIKDSITMAALPATSNGEESILVAGVGHVTRYRLKK